MDFLHLIIEALVVSSKFGDHSVLSLFMPIFFYCIQLSIFTKFDVLNSSLSLNRHTLLLHYSQLKQGLNLAN